MYATQNNKSSTLNISLNRNKDGKSDPTNMSCYKQQQSEIEKQQQLFHMMGSATPAYGGHPSATHFLASLLQNPTVLQNPELMASVAGMLQSSLNPHIVGGPMGVAAGPPAGPAPAAAQDQMPQTGNCFRNFSIPTSDTSSQLQSIINSCHGGAASSIHAESCGDQSSHRSPSSTSSHHKYGRKSSDRFSASSHASSDNESNNSVDIGKFANSSELVINKVMTVIEEILANDNIRKNNFLAKLFEDQAASGNNKKDKRPEILVKRVAGFKRVKAITTEFKVVQAAMGMSKMFDLGADGLSAFRIMPLPQLGSEDQQTINNNKDQTQQKQQTNIFNKTESSSPSSKDQQRIVKKVLAINFTSADFTIEKVTNIFEKIGEIAQISLIRPSRKIPDFLTEYAQWVPDLGTKPCAVIDFENQEAAQNACREINLSNRLGNGIRCALLKPGARIKRTLYRKYNSDTTVSTDKTISNESSTTMTSNNQKTYSRSSMDSGVSHNSPLDDQTPFKKQQSNFNRKNVKKAISKHFISLGAWKNSSEQPNGMLEGNHVVLSNISGFVRQPRGPVGQGFGLRRTVMV